MRERNKGTVEQKLLNADVSSFSLSNSGSKYSRCKRLLLPATYIKSKDKHRWVQSNFNQCENKFKPRKLIENSISAITFLFF